MQNSLTLTSDQQSAVDGICAECADPGRRAARIVLCGYAGTGKTVTTAALVSELYAMRLQVVVATPTHKARAQVERALTAQGADGFECVTVHRLLGLRQIRDYETGKESFKPDPSGRNMLKEGLHDDREEKWQEETWQEYKKRTNKQIDVIIVDETSMLQEDLYRLLCQEAGSRPIVFVGDDRQLLPVKEDKACAAFVDAESQYRLVDVLRHDGAILNLATATRQLSAGRSRFVHAAGGGSHVCAYTNRLEWLNSLLEMMTSNESLNNPDYCRALAWTNNAVRDLNDRIHWKRYGKDAPQYMAGMTCVTADCVPDPFGGPPIFNSTIDLYVHEAEIEAFKAPHDCDSDELWTTWLLVVEAVDGYGRVQVRALDRKDEKRWKAAQKEIADKAKKCDDKKDRKALWRSFYERQDQFGRLEPASALTIHKSQGSTFDNVFLHWSIDGYSSAPTAQQNQLAYVGITRASCGLYVVGDR